jgi:alanine dehydrogenase
MLKLMKKTALIVDISCDKSGAVQSCIPTTWHNPTYKAGGVTHCCIDNLPAALPAEASVHLSSMIFPFVLSVANSVELKAGLMTRNGVFEFRAPAKKQPQP